MRFATGDGRLFVRPPPLPDNLLNSQNRLDEGLRGYDALSVRFGNRVLRRDPQTLLHMPIHLFQMVCAVAQDDIQQLHNGHFIGQ